MPAARRPPSQITNEPDRQTDSFNWDTTPHTPRLYCKPAPPLRLPRHNDLLGLHRLITGMEKVHSASPAEPRRPVAPLSCSVGTLGVRMCITERLEEKSRPCSWVFRLSRAARIIRERRLAAFSQPHGHDRDTEQTRVICTRPALTPPLPLASARLPLSVRQGGCWNVKKSNRI